MGKIIWIASFPKSGNTWMRAFLANYVMNTKEPFQIEDLRAFTLSDTRPRFFQEAAGRPVEELSDIETVELRGRAQELIANFKPHDHFVKTHSQNTIWADHQLINPLVSKGAIYLVRNPLDLASSYAAHLGLNLDDAINLMASDQNATLQVNYNVLTFIGSWEKHVTSWLQNDQLPSLLIRYEDLLTNPLEEFSKVLRALGTQIVEERLSRAIQFSSFTELAKQENASGFSERPPHADRFFRQGKSGSWKEQLSSQQIERITGKHGRVMKMLGYLT
ncbi:MAG: sulfotransferase [Rhodospirillaceae bacterium]|nr:sulfotransferase [Rhodospirillaceae bacterium]|tara:strand:- start:22 stop:849 length:828 start_codon:yes stop_codon:yes gene_type:complete